LNKELKQLQIQIDTSLSQIAELEKVNAQLVTDMQQLKEKHTIMQRDTHTTFQEQLNDLNQSKEKEISFLQLEMKKLLDENEKVIKLKLIKRILNNLLK
jgi:hypothetical protein